MHTTNTRHPLAFCPEREPSMLAPTSTHGAGPHRLHRGGDSGPWNVGPAHGRPLQSTILHRAVPKHAQRKGPSVTRARKAASAAKKADTEAF